jgi:hypothetical protein
MKAPAADQQGGTCAANSLERSSTKREFWLLLFGLTLLYVFVLAIGNRRYVWYDELFTFDIARSASLQQLWSRELKFDNHTPTVFLLSRLSMSVFGPTPFGLRFPSMIEFYVGSIAILLYVKRKANIAFAGVAVLMVWVGAPTLFYAAEARPYALIFGSFACLLLSWDTAVSAHPRRLALFGVAISTLLMSAAHLFAPFTLFAFVVAEAVRYWRRREPDYALWAALLLPMLIMLIYIPLIRASEGVFGGLASFGTIGKFFEDTLSAPVMFFVVLAALLVPQPKEDREIHPRFLPEEFILLACLFLSPILVNLILIHRQKAFFDRYGIASQAAILAALSIFLAYRFRLNRVAARAASIVLLFFLLRDQIWHVLRNRVTPNATNLASVEPTQPIVVGQGMVFMEMNHHEEPAVASRLYFLKDADASMRYAHSSFFETFEAPDDMKAAGFPIPGKIEQYSSFVSQHRQFLLIAAPEEWVFIKLRLAGASIAYLDDYKGTKPYVDTVLYLVTMPSNTTPAILRK